MRDSVRRRHIATAFRRVAMPHDRGGEVTGGRAARARVGVAVVPIAVFGGYASWNLLGQGMWVGCFFRFPWRFDRTAHGRIIGGL